MRFFLSCLLPLLLLSRADLHAQAPAAPTPAAQSAAKPPMTADTGAVLLFNDWYLPSYRPGTPAADTTGALLSLFRTRRYAGLLFTAPFIVSMSMALPIASKDANDSRTVAAEAISSPLGSAILAATVVGFIVGGGLKLGDFSIALNL